MRTVGDRDKLQGANKSTIGHVGGSGDVNGSTAHCERFGLSRKEMRKKKRIINKMRKHAYQNHLKLPTFESVMLEKQAEDIKHTKKIKKAYEKKKRLRNKKIEKLQAMEEEEKRKAEEQYEIKKEEKSIKYLEKNLNMKKRKGKMKLPKAFASDGLDFILDVVDSSSLLEINEKNENYEFESTLKELVSSDEEFFDEEKPQPPLRKIDLQAQPQKGIMKKNTIQNKSVRFTNSENELENDCDEDLVNFSNIDNVDQRLEIDDADFPVNGDNDNEAEVDNTDVNFLEHDECNSEEEDTGDKNEDTNNVSIKNVIPKRSMKGVADEEITSTNSHRHKRHRAESSFPIQDENDSNGIDGLNEVENIYGRVEGENRTYQSPACRLKVSEQPDNGEDLSLISRRVKGLLNKVNDSNLSPVIKEMMSLFQSYSRGSVTKVVCSAVEGQCVQLVRVPDRFIMMQILLVAIIHEKVSNSVGTFLLESLVCQLNRNLLGLIENVSKELENIIVSICHCYNFRICDSILIFDIIYQLVDRFSEKDIELLLIILKAVGFTLRKDNPVSLKETILRVQSKASNYDTSDLDDNFRVKFMLEMLMLIKNNNMKKIPDYDPNFLENLRKVQNGLSGKFDQSRLHVGFQDLVNAEEKGRWWLVGAAWQGPSNKLPPPDRDNPQVQDVMAKGFTQKILDLATKQRMNTDIRRNIFCSIMTSEDYVNAFEKLIHMKLNEQQRREIVRVIIEISLNQKSYNPFFSYLLQKLCQHDRNYRMTAQFTYWDKFKDLQNMKKKQLNNLVNLLVHLLVTKSLSLSVFKVLEFALLSNLMAHFLRKVLTEILSAQEDYTIRDLCKKINSLPKLKELCHGLLTFVRQNFTSKEIPKSKFGENCLLIEQLLNVNHDLKL